MDGNGEALGRGGGMNGCMIGLIRWNSIDQDDLLHVHQHVSVMVTSVFFEQSALKSDMPTR